MLERQETDVNGNTNPHREETYIDEDFDNISPELCEYRSVVAAAEREIRGTLKTVSPAEFNSDEFKEHTIENRLFPSIKKAADTYISSLERVGNQETLGDFVSTMRVDNEKIRYIFADLSIKIKEKRRENEESRTIVNNARTNVNKIWG